MSLDDIIKQKKPEKKGRKLTSVKRANNNKNTNKGYQQKSFGNKPFNRQGNNNFRGGNRDGVRQNFRGNNNFNRESSQRENRGSRGSRGGRGSIRRGGIRQPERRQVSN